MAKFNDLSRSLVALAEDSTLIAAIWRLLTHQSDRGLVKSYRERTVDGRGITGKVMIVAMARKLLIALWEDVASGKVPPGMRLHPAV
jgi:transposase